MTKCLVDKFIQFLKGTFFPPSEQVGFFNGPVIGTDINKVTDITTYTWGLVSGIPEIGTIFSIMKGRSIYSGSKGYIC